MTSFSDIDFKQSEDSEKKRRPFVVYLEEDVAKDFIFAVRAKGLYVRETVVKLLREFAREARDEKNESRRDY